MNSPTYQQPPQDDGDEINLLELFDVDLVLAAHKRLPITFAGGVPPMFDRLETAAREQGVDLSAHRARQLSSWMCQAADLILVMEQRHKVEVEQLHPLVRGKVFRLGELGKFDIEDPHRKPREAFDTAYAHIARGVADWVPRIRLLD